MKRKVLDEQNFMLAIMTRESTQEKLVRAACVRCHGTKKSSNNGDDNGSPRPCDDNGVDRNNDGNNYDEKRWNGSSFNVNFLPPFPISALPCV